MQIDITLLGEGAVRAQVDDHRIRTAQDGTSPAPFDLFLASLATCSGYFVWKFCDQRGIPTDRIHMTQSVIRDPETHMVTRIGIDIEIPEDFPECYRTALIQATELCSVKQHLLNPPAIDVRTVAPANAAD
jgi:ribosomal protein S12 methylthiotransferase accessory factor